MTEECKIIHKVRHKSAVRMKRKLKVYGEKYTLDELEIADIMRRLYIWLCHAKYGQTYELRKKMLENFVLAGEIE